MAFAQEIMGCSMIEKSSFLGLNLQNTNQSLLFLRPVDHSRRRLSVLKKGARTRTAAPVVVAAITDDLVKLVKPEKGEKGAIFKVRAVLTVRNKNKKDFRETLVKRLDAFTDQMGRNVVLELYSTDIDPKTRAPKKSQEAVLKDWCKKANLKSERVNYTADILVDSDFGTPGAITIANKHQQEFYLESIVIEGFACGPVHFACNSWVQSSKDHPDPRIFFFNQPHLPDETPAGLKALRERELKDLRGDGTGVRKLSDRIYDYDVYNDLGKPDTSNEFVRPTLKGEKIPYPRRCRTGRLPSYSDVTAESRVEKPLPLYVPRDEQFEETKQNTFLMGRLIGVLHNLLPSLVTNISKRHDFKGFSQIESLYSEGVFLKIGRHDDLLKKLPLPNLVTRLNESSQGGGLLKYDTPKILTKDRFSWLRDDEFARQAIAGVNPVTIEKLRVFPPVCQLDPEVYGPLESALQPEHIEGYLNGMTVQQAIDENKLFIIDYHDIYLPFVERINALDGHKVYATRTIYYLNPSGTLKPVAIELCLPKARPGAQSKRVVTPPTDATTNWIWQLAKAHVCANDAGAHQLAYHWLRTHAAMEPFIMATHRQLSAMHPIYKLLEPHMRYTLEINALARQNLISADGVIETCFTPGRYSMEISASVYKHWRFDLEGLPTDLIRRGMAVPDPTQPHGLKLIIEDYPYAADGLLIWEAIQNWVRTYVNRYYPDASQIFNDRELQAWYAESINVGHADHRHASWWPTLATPDDLASILTIIIWLVSAQHAALNFGQYPYGGYIPNRPPLMRRLIPEENDPEYASFLDDPQKYFLTALPSMLQATKYMAVVETLSTHSPDEEYLGQRQHADTWTADEDMVEAFYRFSAEIQKIEKEIERRNKDTSLRNRCGAGVLPYELLAPSSEPGVTCRGIPNSSSI